MKDIEAKAPWDDNVHPDDVHPRSHSHRHVPSLFPGVRRPAGGALKMRYRDNFALAVSVIFSLAIFGIVGGCLWSMTGRAGTVYMESSVASPPK